VLLGAALLLDAQGIDRYTRILSNSFAAGWPHGSQATVYPGPALTAAQSRVPFLCQLLVLVAI
jgi:hypothetical protein